MRLQRLRRRVQLPRKDAYRCDEGCLVLGQAKAAFTKTAKYGLEDRRELSVVKGAKRELLNPAQNDFDHLDIDHLGATSTSIQAPYEQ
jgi:hypothetical protein